MQGSVFWWSLFQRCWRRMERSEAAKILSDQLTACESIKLLRGSSTRGRHRLCYGTESCWLGSLRPALGSSTWGWRGPRTNSFWCPSSFWGGVESIAFGPQGAHSFQVIARTFTSYKLNATNLSSGLFYFIVVESNNKLSSCLCRVQIKPLNLIQVLILKLRQDPFRQAKDKSSSYRLQKAWHGNFEDLVWT